jgi:plasmid stability protein
MEEEARRILQQALGGPEQLGKLAFDLFGRGHGVDLPEVKRAPHEPLKFSE